jgi:hypothetical protein
LALIPITLAEALKKDMKENSDSALNAHNQFAKNLNDYLKDNLTITGTYVGFLPPPANTPDPLSGSYSFSVSTIAIQGSALAGSASVSKDLWGTTIGLQIVATLNIIGSDQTGLITLTSPVKFIAVPISITVNSGDYNIAMLQLANDIITGLKSTLPTPAVASSTSGGIGSFSPLLVI